ncbi:ABC-2 type transport system ATP-binding protein [Paenibacillus turicensis]|uniref:ABC-2 type transport system ATP-binding protein n=1 Tax=Paenibacillus turicensis TaxID=160487 RepID=A0ABS4FRI7_9BACL|nr:ABC transporter ATP-binding protein [Paenibacillus turicensis]MBP1905039.1 ABC-2 type transport system ATP-binding protein [Paenibacillus turicensis]
MNKLIDSNDLIQVNKLYKSFKGREVVKGISFTIKQGEVVALIGTNGAGKSTTLALLLGIIQPDSGSITTWRENFQAYVGVQLQSTPFFEGYTAEENLALFAAMYHVKLSKEDIRNTLELCNLLEARKTPAIALSGGQQKRLAIAVTTLHNPELIVLDEPAAGLDPRARHEIRALIRDLASNQSTVIFSSHDMEEVARIADRIILMHEGKIVAEGEPHVLVEQYNVDHLEALYLQLTEPSFNHDNQTAKKLLN